MSEATWCDEANMQDWSDREICDYYDQHPELTNLVFAASLGITCGELNEILMDRG